ncbi:MAG: hypothetical protein ACR2H6_03255 [Pyrinomonadaceae bacterium]
MKYLTRHLLSILVSALVIGSMRVGGYSQEPGGRIAPPSALTCDRSDVTLYDGKVLTYRRRKGSTFLRVRTSFDTTEVVTLHHRGTDDPAAFFLLNGEPFGKSDWGKIERRKGVLRPGMQANVWVCRGNPAIQPLVDWQYRRQEAGAGGTKPMQIIKTQIERAGKTK